MVQCLSPILFVVSLGDGCGFYEEIARGGLTGLCDGKDRRFMAG